VAGAEVVEGDAEAEVAVGVDDGFEVGAVADLFDLRDLEDEAVEREVYLAGGLEGELDAGGWAVDGAGHEVDGEGCAGGGEVEAGGEGDGADAAVLVEGVDVFGVYLAEDAVGAFAFGTADEGLVGIGSPAADVDDGLEGHAEGEWLGDAFFTGVTGCAVCWGRRDAHQHWLPFDGRRSLAVVVCCQGRSNHSYGSEVWLDAWWFR
jgi:hypothetical protein